MGFKITTDDYPAKIFRSDKYGFPQYAVAISKKDPDTGDWIAQYQQCRFRKGIEFANGEKIHIRDAFPVLDTWEKGGKQYKKVVWMITDFTYAEQGQRISQQPIQKTQMQMEDMTDSFQAADDDIPF